MRMRICECEKQTRLAIGQAMEDKLPRLHDIPVGMLKNPGPKEKETNPGGGSKPSREEQVV